VKERSYNLSHLTPPHLSPSQPTWLSELSAVWPVKRPSLPWLRPVTAQSAIQCLWLVGAILLRWVRLLTMLNRAWWRASPLITYLGDIRLKNPDSDSANPAWFGHWNLCRTPLVTQLGPNDVSCGEVSWVIWILIKRTISCVCVCVCVCMCGCRVQVNACCCDRTACLYRRLC